MALATYSDLQTSVANWLHRSDLTAQIPDFISLAESRLNRLLTLRSMETDAVLSSTPASRYITLPTDFNSPVALWLEDVEPREKLDYVLPGELAVTETAGFPEYWAVDNDQIAFERPTGGTYGFTLRYLKKFALSDAFSTNALLTAYPDAYLFGALLEAAPYMRDDARVGLWQERFDRAIQEISNRENTTRARAPLMTDLGMFSGKSYDITRGY